ncbi:hypothetical protein ACLESO_52600 [Pyxidicoccus sp. 3LG]
MAKSERGMWKEEEVVEHAEDPGGLDVEEFYEDDLEFQIASF